MTAFQLYLKKKNNPEVKQAISSTSSLAWQHMCHWLYVAVAQDRGRACPFLLFLEIPFLKATPPFPPPSAYTIEH